MGGEPEIPPRDASKVARPRRHTCSRGKAAPDRTTTLQLFADSGGYCQRPACRLRLFVNTGSTTVHVGEMAHVIAANDEGPRADATLTDEQRGAYENLILLCPRCHTLIDKAPNDFPDHLVKSWKAAHVEILTAALGVRKFETRSEARDAVEPYLIRNWQIFEALNPGNEYRYNPESPEAAVWQRKMLADIIPNNRAVLMIADGNRQLLTDAERRVIEQLRIHLSDLESRHVGRETTNKAQRFPGAAANLFSKEQIDGRSE